MTDTKKVKKAVILAAGFGTRFLPASKASPKEMLPLVDKPIIQYLVEEVVQAGMKEIILVTGRGKRAIEDHFDRSRELEMFLESRGKQELAQMIKNISALASFAYVRQKEQKGTADAVLEAMPFIGQEPFAVTSGDDIIEANPPCMAQLVDIYEKYQVPVTCLMRVPPTETHRYGVIEGEEVAPRVWKIRRAVEKPAPGQAPTNLATLTKFVLTPEFVPFLEGVKPQNNELYIPPAIDAYIKEGGSFYGYEIQGDWYDCGNKLGYMKGIVHFGLKHPEIGKEFREYLRSIDI
ncbi:MAG: UTP--glucose-1-phosphate uridylyltransferase [Candidatus Sungbacteria bacterium]|uniref:UTP--glucose-1-phosphate uridylyltransferase n=1 Tax=Candidatus Sungiibacteriota bacterium TaxID=2750080 RepID=A0A932QYI3_9BACT|nr:UTP--glucose-1-phosphate uridylyltransferase [Candidatus Sungbacteria bacterium]